MKLLKTIALLSILVATPFCSTMNEAPDNIASEPISSKNEPQPLTEQEQLEWMQKMNIPEKSTENSGRVIVPHVEKP